MKLNKKFLLIPAVLAAFGAALAAAPVQSSAAAVENQAILKDITAPSWRDLCQSIILKSGIGKDDMDLALRYISEDRTYEDIIEAMKYYDIELPEPPASENKAITAAAIHRIYNENSGEHMYTGSEKETADLVAAGWSDESIAWQTPSSGEPVYRCYNKNSGEHFYTTNTAEVAQLGESGWSSEGLVFYSDESMGTAVYRLFNPNAAGAGSHHYTTSSKERDELIAAGWSDEGIAFYGVDDSE